jgi:outer membrane receptor protein involved in Fe transport
MKHAQSCGGLLGSVALLALMPAAVHAQAAAAAPAAPQAPDVAQAQAAQGSQAAPAPADASTSQPAEAKGDEVVVTGSRIARRQFAAPNPIVSFNAAAIQESGNTNITNFLQRIPALTNSRNFTNTSGGNAVYSQPFGAAGLNQLDLRGLGPNRTLVLVDGRRHVAGSVESAAVDINAIPTDLIERVDVLTAGASAVYGADGVSGVVNFILKRDFDGVSARSQFGISSRGDAANRFASIAVGHNFADGRGNITLAYEYNADEPLANDDRRYLREDRRQYLIPNDAKATNPNAYTNILVGNLRYPNESPIGAVFIGDEATPSYNGLGNAYRPGAPASYYTTGLDNDDSPVAGFYSGDLAPRIRRNDLNLLTRYDFSDAFKLSLEGKFVQVDARTFDYFGAIYYTPVSIDNPFMPQSIRDAAIAAGTDAVHVNRDNLDYGRHGEADRRRTYRGVIDASGRISDHARYDAYFEYGRTDVRINKLNEVLYGNYLDAIDAVRNPTTGAITCRSGNAGCIPVNLFGPGPISRDALNYFQINDASYSQISQQVADASVSGDFGQFFRLPGGPVQFSFGGEYRREASSFQPSANFVDGNLLTYNEPTLVSASGGHFDVKEAFGELNAPIFQGQRFAETLSVGAAYRYSSYSTVGSTNTWQVNGVYAPVRDISFRGSYGKAVRAPNIQELFQPSTGVNNFITDPCTNQELNHGTPYRQANCVALLQRYGVSYSNPTAIAALQTGNNVNGITSGNAGLKAEAARTWTAGVVLRPRWIRGLTLSVDWYDIRIKNAINTPSPSDLPALCVDQPTLDNPFCGEVMRQQGTGQVVSYVTQPENVASFRTSGADLNVDYLLTTARAGVFDFRFVGGYLHRLTQIPTPGAPLVNNADQFGRPKWNFNLSPTWTLGGLSVTYNLRWFDRTRTQARQATDDDPLFAAPGQLRYHALFQHDLQLQYALKSGLALYVGAQNLTDQKPDLGNSINAPISAIGRYFYVGAKLNLGAGRH